MNIDRIKASFDEGAAFGRYIDELISDGESPGYINELIDRERKHFISCFSKEADFEIMVQEWEKGLHSEFEGQP